jgi:hypothetical protein
MSGPWLRFGIVCIESDPGRLKTRFRRPTALRSRRISNARGSAALVGSTAGRGCTELAPAKAMVKRTAAMIEPIMAAAIFQAKAGVFRPNVARTPI